MILIALLAMAVSVMMEIVDCKSINIFARRVSRWCAAADLFVLPSLVESWPMVAIEALTTGTPVLSADTAGGIEVRDCFPDDVELVPRGDPAALATAVVRWLDHSRRTGDATRRRLEQEFTPAALAGAYLEIYREALGQRR